MHDAKHVGQEQEIEDQRRPEKERIPVTKMFYSFTEGGGARSMRGDNAERLASQGGKGYFARVTPPPGDRPNVLEIDSGHYRGNSSCEFSPHIRTMHRERGGTKRNKKQAETGQKQL